MLLSLPHIMPLIRIWGFREVHDISPLSSIYPPVQCSSSISVFLVSTIKQPQVQSSSPPLLSVSRFTYTFLGRRFLFLSILPTCPAHFIPIFTILPIRHYSMGNSFDISSIFLRSTLFTPSIYQAILSHTPALSVV